MATSAKAAVIRVGLGILLTLAACGDADDDAPSGASDTSVVVSTSAPAEEPVPPAPAAEAVDLGSDVGSRIEIGAVTWRIEVTNVSDQPAVITFPTGQTGDAVLRDREGAIVHRASDGQFYVQQTQSAALEPDETRAFEVGDDLSGLEPGIYELVLELTAIGPPEPFTKRIRLVAPAS